MMMLRNKELNNNKKKENERKKYGKEGGNENVSKREKDE